MPRKIDIIELNIPISQTVPPAPITPEIKLSDAVKTKLAEIISEHKIVNDTIKLSKMKKQLELDKIGKVFKILKDSYDLVEMTNSSPEPISGTTLCELYGNNIPINSLTAKIRNYLLTQHNNTLVLLTKAKNKRTAYYLAKYSS